ncbi:MAG: hypothetical protein HC780_00470 [Leptolyngbyaceae cyanobacterium CSU_1_3]|nr:hypothetical protein [Leptolyngbyaceae cyanobacterium CSU_1_3]
MQLELPRSREEILHLIDHCWMVEDPDRDEHAFLFRLIQERHRVQFEQAFQQTAPDEHAAFTHRLGELSQQRDRAEEILYWLYRDSQLRQQGNNLPDQQEQLASEH